MLTAVKIAPNQDLKISPLCLGTMNFGEPGHGHQGDWTLGLDQARPIFKAAIEQGLFYFDCANIYGQGASERVVGQLLREFLPRDEFVIATKIGFPMAKGQGGLTRESIPREVDASLKRLGVDHIDHLVIHRHPHGFGNGELTPIEETLEALHELVRQGKVRYLGASSMFAWQFVELQYTARLNGWTPFVSMQNHYNLIYREEEREMNPYCVKAGVALMPWSPLARGILAGSYKDSLEQGLTNRSMGQDKKRTASLYGGEMDFVIVNRVRDLAKKYEKTAAQIALSWLLNKPEITAPVIGVSCVEQLNQLIDSAEIELDENDKRFLEEAYQTRPNLLSHGYS